MNWRRFCSLMVACVSFFGGFSGQIMGQSQLTLPEGFVGEALYDVPAAQGSWVSLTSDPQGRLIASDQYGKLYRITLNPKVQVEPIQVKLGRAQGLLCAFNSLYVVAHRGDGMPAGLYRVTDQNGDDQYDTVKLLRQFQGGGEHGPHAVILSPDKKSLFICAGNHTNIPNPETSRVPRLWKEDQILPRLPDANGHATGKMAPGGWICKTDPDGRSFELVSMGYRNEYDIAFDPNGELFTYDADMEWDVGLPWYRPTRVCHATSGSEFGWRYGTGKWPAYYPDSRPAVLDIGPGSPTGITFGTGAKFPAKYQNALFISDWSYGKIYAVHLKPDGASYTGEKELFCTSTALPVTDLVVNPTDGSLYFLIGGRRSKSRLFRVRYTGSESTEPANYTEPSPLVQWRRGLDQFHRTLPEGEGRNRAIKMAWEKLGHEDRAIRFAARTVLEHQPVSSWLPRLEKEKNPQVILEATLALIRTQQPEAVQSVVAKLGELKWDGLANNQRIHLLRNYGLFARRLGNHPEISTQVLALAGNFPCENAEVDRELSRLLVAFNEPTVTGKIVQKLAAATSQHEQIHYALALSSAKNGWAAGSRKSYFQWFIDAAKLQGGNSFGGYLKNIRKQAMSNMPVADQQVFRQLLAAQPPVTDPYADLKARAFVKKWKVEDLVPVKDEEWKKRNLARGQELFAVANCYKCHRIQGSGGIVGPDLTAAGRRFNTRDLLETLIDPSKEVSDQYQASIFLMEDGRTITGRVSNLNGKVYMIQTDMIKPNQMLRIPVDQIEDMKPSKVSMMPTGLLDTMTREEILDLLAYMRSTAEPTEKPGTNPSPKPAEQD